MNLQISMLLSNYYVSVHSTAFSIFEWYSLGTSLENSYGSLLSHTSQEIAKSFWLISLNSTAVATFSFAEFRKSTWQSFHTQPSNRQWNFYRNVFGFCNCLNLLLSAKWYWNLQCEPRLFSLFYVVCVCLKWVNIMSLPGNLIFTL